MTQFAKALFQVQVLMTLLAHLGILGTVEMIALGKKLKGDC
jgi:hypothetical protein